MSDSQAMAGRLEAFIRAMPKAELHVHLEGATRPETLIALADRNGFKLPATDIGGLRDWYQFKDFDHFLLTYLTVVQCIQTPDDIELIAREFFQSQAAQSVWYCEFTYTALFPYKFRGIPFVDQLSALNTARRWAQEELGVRSGIVIDIPRGFSAEEALMVADWSVGAMSDGVVALGLGGTEVSNPPEDYALAFSQAREAGLPGVPHAGEVVGPESIWGALRVLNAARVGHGVRCLEDTALVAELRDRQIPLEVCPTSNVKLGVVPSFAEHPLPGLIDQGLYVTLNSDDPPMFNTTLTDEYVTCAQSFGWQADDIERIAIDGARATLLPEAEKAALVRDFEAQIATLRTQIGL